jgi:branched-chain amino acid transport system substrate-binding protein
MQKGERMITRRSKWISAVSVLALALAACGDDDDDDGGAADTTGAAPATTAGEAPATTAGEAPATTAGEAPATTAGEGPATTGGTPTGEPVTIGVLTSVTGNFAPWGVQVRDGMQLAVDDINAAGGVAGRPLELEVSDDQTDPDRGATEIERLIEGGAVAVGGVISTDVALATAQTAEELETPLFLVKAGSEAILTPESRYTFRTCLPAAPMVAGPIAQFAENEGLSRIGVIIADYGWGQAFRAAIENEFADIEGVELQVEVAPVPETDFTTYLRSLEEFDPELIVATGHPPGSGPITVQSADLGMDVPVTGAYSPWPLVMSGAGDAALDRYYDFDCADYESPEYQDLAVRYLEMSENPFMEDDAVAGYGIVTMVAQAVEEVGDDPVAIAEYLHANTFDLPGYPFEMGWTEWGELATAQPLFSVVRSGSAPEGLNEAGDWYPVPLLLPEPLEPYEPQ